MVEYVDIFDKDNVYTGVIKEKDKALFYGDFHRTAHVWIINNKKEITKA